VTFHDNTPFNAQAVKANIDYIRNPNHHSQKAIFMLGPLNAVEVLNEFTIAFYLKEPFAPLLDSLSDVYLGIASPSALEEWGPQEYAFHQVGTGPYQFVEYIPNDQLTLTRNPDYAWGPKIYQNARAEIETIVFRFYEDAATRAFALESGEVDVLGEIPHHDAERLDQSSEFTLYPVPIPGQPTQFLFNTQRSPTDNAQVREALLLSVNRRKIVRTVYGDYSMVAQGPLSESTFLYGPSTLDLNYNPQKAHALLEDAGWKRENDSIRNREGVPFELRIVAPPWGSNPEVAQLVRADWEAIGAKVTIEIAPGFGPLKEIQSSGNYNAIGINFFASDPDLLRSFYTSNGIYNWSGYQETGLDQLLHQASQVTNNSELRCKLYDQVSQHINQLALVLPIREYTNLVIANNRVQGLRFAAQGWYPYLIDLQLMP
jgi:peptide/nickel transport system substrate-binding protein